jgi:integrase
LTEIRSWGVRDLEFFVSGSGRRYTTNAINKAWNKWREAAAPIRDLKMTVHGLRATAIHDRRSAGTEDGAIADEIGISVKMVSRYLRFADKAASARASRDRRERKKSEFENSGGV